MISDSEYDHVQTNIFDVVEQKREIQTNCLSPSSSSGCESGMASSFEDEQFPLSDDAAFFGFCEEPFTELFPELC